MAECGERVADESVSDLHENRICESCDSTMKPALDTEASVEITLDGLSEEPVHFGDCCPGVSKPLINALLDRLPQDPALILSIGSGSGLFEAILLQVAEKDRGRCLNLRGIEVPPCINRHLPQDRVLRVPCSLSLHPEAFFASALMFVYPRRATLVAMYLDAFLDGALETLIWLGHRNDWPEMELLLLAAFFKLEQIDGPGIPNYELLAVASLPRRTPQPRSTITNGWA